MFSPVSSHIQLIIPRSESHKVLAHYCALTNIDCVRVLLATIRNLGACPCPRCGLPKEQIPQVGTIPDDNRRSRLKRAHGTHFTWGIRTARDGIYRFGKTVKSKFVEDILSPLSYVPTSVCPDFALVHLKYLPAPRMPLVTALVLLSTFSLSLWLTSCMNSNWVCGKLFSYISFACSWLRGGRLSKISMPGNKSS